MNAPLPLLTGDPSGLSTPASFTRFVLPFGYQLARYQENTQPVQGSRFVASGPTDWLHSAACGACDFDQQREAYLTPEVGKVLYERAKWFVLEHCGSAPVLSESAMIMANQQPVTIHFRTPALVLFEYEDELQRFSNHPDTSSQCLATGFLVLEAWYEGEFDFESMLIWNEVARYWQQPFKDHATSANLAILDRLGSASSYLERWKRLLNHPIHDPCRRGQQDGLIRFLPQEDSQWNVHPDSRAFVWTCAILKEKPEIAAQSPGWLALLNVDGRLTAKLSDFDRKWADEHTYMRWASSGTLYGFTPHSGAMLASEAISNPPTWQHFRSMYFDQLLLMLYLRTGIFRFSRRLTELACELSRSKVSQAEGQQNDFEQQFDALRWEFAHFTNLYQFPLISHQQQAVEMYALLRQQLDVCDFYNEISTEIATTQQLLADHVAKQQSRVTMALTYVAFFGLVISTVVGVWALESITDLKFANGLGIVFCCALLLMPFVSKRMFRFVENLFIKYFS